MEHSEQATPSFRLLSVTRGKPNRLLSVEHTQATKMIAVHA